MEQHQGALVDDKGQPIVNLHVSMRVHGNKWKGVIESPTPVAVEARPLADQHYRLRLDDGQEKTIHVGPVTLVHTKYGDAFRANFDSNPPK